MGEILYGICCTVFHISNVKEPTPEAIAQAKLHPGGWVLVVDHFDGPDDKVPPERVQGAWKVDLDGNITGDFVPNPKYRSIEDWN